MKLQFPLLLNVSFVECVIIVSCNFGRKKLFTK